MPLRMGIRDLIKSELVKSELVEPNLLNYELVERTNLSNYKLVKLRTSQTMNSSNEQTHRTNKLIELRLG